MVRQARSVAMAFFVVLVGPSCGNSSGHDGGESGGASGAVTAGGAGGVVPGATGGATSNGGAGTGGRTTSTGGATSNGGATASGGSAGARSTATGGASTGGVPSSGGTAGAAGSGGAGGASGIRPFKGVANSPCAARTALGVSWYYNWEQRENEACSDGRGGEFVPMIWGHTGAEQSEAAIQSAVSGFVGKGYRYVLGFNEPDNSSQANIPVATAISLLPAFANPGILVGTAATQANTTGQAWFKDYMGQINASTSLRADFIAIHWYGWNAGSCDGSASQLESYIKYAEGFSGNRPIWITEWGCLNQSAPTVDGVVSFYKGALAVFAKHPRIERYAWYPWSTNCGLTNSDGSLTPLGTAYAAAPAQR